VAKTLSHQPRERAGPADPEGYLPLRKKNQNISPTITKTIRRANRKNASMDSIDGRLAKGLAALEGGGEKCGF